jgi:peptidyl-prolyl cis-trans isomerase SurA
MEPRIPIEDIDAIKARLRDFTDQINRGERTFSTLARLYSEDMTSAIQGGDIGFTSKVELSPEFANVAFNLSDPNRVSNIVETEYGYHIIQLIEKRGDRINVRHILLRPKVSDEELNKAINRLDTLYEDIMANKLTFDMATYYSADKNTRNNKGLMVNQNMESRNYSTSKFEMQELPQGMGVVVDKMEVGEISRPFKMKDSMDKDIVSIVRLKSRIKAHQANISDDFQVLKSLVEAQKKEEILNDWILNKQKSTFIKINDNWKDCDFKYSGWIKE